MRFPCCAPCGGAVGHCRCCRLPGFRGNPVCGIRASEALFGRERENLLGTSAACSGASHRSGVPDSCEGCPQGCCGRQLFDDR